MEGSCLFQEAWQAQTYRSSCCCCSELRKQQKRSASESPRRPFHIRQCSEERSTCDGPVTRFGLCAVWFCNVDWCDSYLVLETETIVALYVNVIQHIDDVVSMDDVNKLFVSYDRYVQISVFLRAPHQGVTISWWLSAIKRMEICDDGLHIVRLSASCYVVFCLELRRVSAPSCHAVRANGKRSRPTQRLTIHWW